MSALGDTVGNFRALGAAAARLVADLLDGPELCGHDVDLPVTDLGPFEYYAETGESSRAEGTQRAQTPGEESGNPSTPPSPGDYPYPSPAELDELSDCTFLNEAAAGLDRGAANAPRVFDRMHLFNLADAARNRAAQFEVAESEPECPRDAYYCGDCGVLNLVPHLAVSHDDLAAHILAIQKAWHDRWNRGELNALTLSDEIASDLLSDYHVTKK